MLNMDVAGSSKPAVPISQTTWHDTSEGFGLHIYVAFESLSLYTFSEFFYIF
jgi:hypothetical protein